MRYHHQLFRHDPGNGVWGDCHRTAIACVLDLHPASVPHFNHGAPSAEKFTAAVETWLRARGLTQISIAYPGETGLQDLLNTVANCNGGASGLLYLLGGASPRGFDHTVVCRDNAIIHDPAIDGGGVVAPLSDGHWWVTFFGALQASRPEAIAA